jgi:hypothetical protein
LSLRNEVKELASSLSEVTMTLQQQRTEKLNEMLLASVDRRVKELVGQQRPLSAFSN